MSRFGAQLLDTPERRSPYGATPIEEPTHAPPTPVDDTDEIVNWAGRQVPMSRIRAVAEKRGSTPEDIMRLGTWQGRLEAGIASTAVGQTFLRLEQGLSDLAVAGLDLTDRAGLIDINRNALQGEQRARNSFLNLIEHEGDVQSILGETGGRIYNNAIRSIGKVAAASVGGPITLYSAIGADSFDTNLVEAERENRKGVDALVYAGKKTGVELAVMRLMAGVGERLGVRTLEESFTPAARREAARFVEKSGLKAHLVSLANKSQGAFLEAGEESITDTIQQFIEIDEGFRPEFSFSQMLEAGATGALATGVVGSIQGINNTLKQKQGDLESFVSGAADGKMARSRASTEEIEDTLSMDDAEFRKAWNIKTTDPMYVEEFKTQLQDRVTADTNTAAIMAEVTGADVSSSGAPIPENALEARELASNIVETKQPDISVIDEGTAARHRDMDRDAQILGLDSYFSPGARQQAAVLAEARQLGLPELAVSLANDVIRSKRPLRDVEQAALTIKFAELKRASTDVARRLTESTEDADIGTLGAELDRLASEAQVIHDGLAVSGTQASLSMLNRKSVIGDDYSIVSVQARAKSAKRTNLSDSETSEFRRLAVQHDELQTKLDQQDLKVRETTALQVLKSMPETDSDISSLYTRAQQLLDGGCDTI